MHPHLRCPEPKKPQPAARDPRSATAKPGNLQPPTAGAEPDSTRTEMAKPAPLETRIQAKHHFRNHEPPGERSGVTSSNDASASDPAARRAEVRSADPLGRQTGSLFAIAAVAASYMAWVTKAPSHAESQAQRVLGGRVQVSTRDYARPSRYPAVDTRCSAISGGESVDHHLRSLSCHAASRRVRRWAWTGLVARSLPIRRRAVRSSCRAAVGGG